MSFNRLVRYFLPKDRKFLPLFGAMCQRLMEMSETLVEAVNSEDLEERHRLFSVIERMEHECDQLTHQVHLELGQSMFTPFDRADIHSLISSLDDVADYIHDSSNRMLLYKVEVITEPIRDMAALIHQATVELAKAVAELKDLKNFRNITDACVRINTIENKADDIFDRAVGQLFDYEKDAISLIKYKEVLSSLETATDRCEDVANVLESILVKNA